MHIVFEQAGADRAVEFRTPKQSEMLSFIAEAAELPTSIEGLSPGEQTRVIQAWHGPALRFLLTLADPADREFLEYDLHPMSAVVAANQIRDARMPSQAVLGKSNARPAP